MATLTANIAFDFRQMNFNELTTTEFFDFYDNANESFNGVVYQDVIEVSDTIGTNRYLSSFFGGTNLTVNASDAVTGGTVTGFVEAITSGTGIVSVNWALQGFSYSAVSIYNAVQSVSTADDFAILASLLGGNDTMTLSPFADYARGYAGDDVLKGNAGADILVGDAGNDRLEGGSGADKLIGGSGADQMYGGAGNDKYYVDNSGDEVFEIDVDPLTALVSDPGGIDNVISSRSFSLSSSSGVKFVEKLTFIGSGNVNGTGNGLDNVIRGNDGDNILYGKRGADVLKGGAGADKLVGGNGKDILKGDAGADKLLGGGGSDLIFAGTDNAVDTIIYKSKADSALGALFRDKIYNFASGTDLIDLTALDADTAQAGNQAFAFSTSGAAANSIWVVDTGADLMVQGDMNGDASADFEIQLMGINSVTATDFLL